MILCMIICPYCVAGKRKILACASKNWTAASMTWKISKSLVTQCCRLIIKLNVFMRQFLISTVKVVILKKKPNCGLSSPQTVCYGNVVRLVTYSFVYRKRCDLDILSAAFESLKNAVINKKKNLAAQITKHYDELKPRLKESVAKCKDQFKVIEKVELICFYRFISCISNIYFVV